MTAHVSVKTGSTRAAKGCFSDYHVQLYATIDNHRKFVINSKVCKFLHSTSYIYVGRLDCVREAAK